MVERWRPAVGYEDHYEVSNYGRVKRIKAGCGTWVGRILNPCPNGEGYLQVKLSVDSVGWDEFVHQLVITAFVGPRPEGENIVCNHGDGNKKNNHDWNLEWVTRSEDSKHKYYVLCKNIGSVNPCSKYYVVTSPEGEEIKVHGLRNFCKLQNLNYDRFRASGKYQGWKIRVGRNAQIE